MDPFTPKPRKGPEAKIQAAIIAALQLRGWHVMETHGNLFQSGFPDLYATHKMYGGRWIEVKNKASYRFTAAQIQNFPKMVSNGSGVWVLVSAEQSEIDKLFSAPNWWVYLK